MTNYREILRLRSLGINHSRIAADNAVPVVSDANKGLIAAIRKRFPGASWQRCKVHFMRNILAHVPQKEKDAFAAQLKGIWLAPSVELACQRARQLSERYEKRFPRAIEVLEDGLEDSLGVYPGICVNWELAQNRAKY